MEAIVLLTPRDSTIRNVLEIEQRATLETILGVNNGLMQGLAAKLDGPSLKRWDPALDSRKGNYKPAVTRETSVRVPTWVTHAQLIADVIPVEAPAAGLYKASRYVDGRKIFEGLDEVMSDDE